MYTNSREGRGKASPAPPPPAPPPPPWRQAVQRFSHPEYFNYTSTPWNGGNSEGKFLKDSSYWSVLFPFSTFYNSHEMLVRKYSVLYFEYDGYCGTSLYCRGDDRDLSTVVFWLSTWPHVFNMISQLFHSRNPLLNSCRLLNFRFVTLQK